MCIKKSFRPFLKNFTFFLHGIVENGFSATMDIAMALCAHGEPHNMRLKFAICQICQISNAYCAAPRGRTTPWQFPEYLKCPSLRYCEERNLNFSKITKMGFSLSGAGSCSISERQCYCAVRIKNEIKLLKKQLIMIKNEIKSLKEQLMMIKYDIKSSYAQ